MLEGVVPFPPEYQKRYREKGYWQDKSLAQEFAVLFERYADRVALIAGDQQVVDRMFALRPLGPGDRITAGSRTATSTG